MNLLIMLIALLTLIFIDVPIGVALGLLGSWFAAARHMRAIEPR